MLLNSISINNREKWTCRLATRILDKAWMGKQQMNSYCFEMVPASLKFLLYVVYLELYSFGDGDGDGWKLRSSSKLPF
jgi:hypothetical protein